MGCQRLLTVGKWAGGDALEVLERRVDLEGLSKRFCALWAESVVVETANRAEIGVSAAIDSLESSVRRRT